MFVLFPFRPKVYISDNVSVTGHVAQGLSLQLVERPSEIPTFTNLSADWNETCAAWNDWYPKKAYWGMNTDSGLR